MHLWLYKTRWALAWDSGAGKKRNLSRDTLSNRLLLILLFSFSEGRFPFRLAVKQRIKDVIRTEDNHLDCICDLEDIGWQFPNFNFIRALGVYYLYFKIHDIEETYNKDLHQSAAVAALSMAKHVLGWRILLSLSSWKLKQLSGSIALSSSPCKDVEVHLFKHSLCCACSPEVHNYTG